MRTPIIISNIPLLFMLASMTSPAVLWAAPGDTVQPYVSVSITHDSNLLRLSNSTDPLLVTGQTSVADTIKQGVAGLKMDWKQGRQEVMLDASISETRFSRFTSLDYQGKNLLSRWNWQLGNAVSGDIGYDRNTVLGSFAEQQRLVDNLSTQERKFFDGAWQVQPGWRLSGSLSRATYSVENRPASDTELMNYGAGIYFTPPSGNEIGIRSTRQAGSYPYQELFFGVPVDNGFTQNQLLATVNWLYSGHIRVNGQAGVVSRNHNQFSARDFNGKTMRGTLTWLASGKSQVDLVAWNEIDSYDDLTTSYIQSKGVSLEPVWNPTGKLGVSARVQHVKRGFLGDPGLLLSPQPTRQDTVNSASLSVSYQPIRAVSISVSAQTERRSSNRAFMDYVANTYNLSASFRF